MKFAWETVNSIDEGQAASRLMIVEGFLTGVSREAEVNVDPDSLIRSFLEQVDLSPGERADFASEPTTALSEAKRMLFGTVGELLAKDERRLAADFPFEVSYGPQINITLRESITVVGLAYIWRAAFGAVSEKLLQLPKDDRQKFDAQSAKLFELFATLALAGRGSGPVWYLGRHRSVHKLLRSLEHLCSYLGSGEVEQATKLRAYVRASNDGGVDAVSVFAPGGSLESGSAALLLSATIQVSNRAAKVIGDKEKKRFRKLFRDEPLLAMHGVLAVPFESDSRDLEFCADSDSIYLDMPAIYRFMMRLPVDFERHSWGRHLSISVRRRMRHLVTEAG